MWDFSTEPEYQEKLDWAREFVKTEVRDLEVLGVDRDTVLRLEEPLRQKVKDAGLWAAHLPPELGGGGLGQVKLALLHEILGQAFYASEVFGNMAPDSGNAELIAVGATDEQKDRWLYPLLEGKLRSAFSMTEPGAGADPTLLSTRAVLEKGGGWGRVGDQRAQVVHLERAQRRHPDRDGRDRSGRAAAPAGLDVHRAEG